MLITSHVTAQLSTFDAAMSQKPGTLVPYRIAGYLVNGCFFEFKLNIVLQNHKNRSHEYCAFFYLYPIFYSHGCVFIIGFDPSPCFKQGRPRLHSGLIRQIRLHQILANVCINGIYHGFIHSYGHLPVITGHFYGVIHSINGVLLVLITDKWPNCTKHALSCKHQISLWDTVGLWPFSWIWPRDFQG